MSKEYIKIDGVSFNAGAYKNMPLADFLQMMNEKGMAAEHWADKKDRQAFLKKLHEGFYEAPEAPSVAAPAEKPKVVETKPPVAPTAPAVPPAKI